MTRGNVQALTLPSLLIRRPHAVQEPPQARGPPPDHAAQVVLGGDGRGHVPAARRVHALHEPHRRGRKPAAHPQGKGRKEGREREAEN